MDTFSTWSDTTFQTAKPYDAEADRSWPEWLGHVGAGAARLPADLASEEGRASAARVFDAAWSSSRAVDSLRSRDIARDDWFSEVADRVKASSGVALTNPAYAPSGGGGAGLINSLDGPPAETRADLERRFFDTIDQLKGAHPDLADIDRNGVDAAVAAKVRGIVGANAALADDPAINPWIKGAASLAGGMGGQLSTGDPVALASLIAPVGGAGRTVLARIASAMLTQGAVGAAAAAAEQPAVQSWRADVGLSHGLGEAVANIGEGALFGAVGGGVMHGLGEAGRALLGGKVAPGDIAATVAAARREGTFVSDDGEAALRAAATHDAANAEMMAARPETVPEHAAPIQLRDGLAAVDDPSRPLPLIDEPVAPHVTDDLARRLSADAPSPAEAIDRFAAFDRQSQSEPSAIASALASTDPALRDLGRVATLDPEIRSRVAAGEIDPQHAAIVAATTPVPEAQASALAAIGEAGARTPADARIAASDSVSAGNAVSSAMAMHRSAPDAMTAPAARRPPRIIDPTRPADMRDAVPVVRDDGSIAFATRDELTRVAERERWMGDIITACKI